MRDGASPNLTLCKGQQQLFNKSYSFDDFVELCKECVIRLDWMRLPIRAAVNPIRNDLTPRGINPTQPMAAEFIRNSDASSASGSNSIPLGENPMILDRLDLSHIGPDGDITAEERLRRYMLKLCMRCGKPGHHADKCRTGQKSSKLNQMDLDEPVLYFNTINLKG
ncbi:hypothetical protein EV44_g4485 [Erysiphe necator]|uniref:CCHC-type domain-containing protein n=1 Tax=Uncinula necator TaxID=52586 RepID=A0A0B1PDS4_UNCNE|nr:hypothetical protein EV44_g4485 [Erysiphe necator]